MQVEKAMIENLRTVMSSSVSAYASNPRVKWVLQWPSQAVLAVTGIYWTQSVADALASGTPGSLQGVAERNSKDLADIVTLVRGKLERLQRATLSALVVMDVHARDAATELASQVLRTSSHTVLFLISSVPC
jgi:dynein heavy chain, axonemal